MAALLTFKAALVGTAGAYSAGDVVGGRIRMAGVGASPGIILRSIVISDLAAQSVDYILRCFRSVPTDIADNAAFDPADADLPNLIYRKMIDAATYRDAYVDNSAHLVEGLDVHLVAAASDDLWWFLEADTAPTYAGTGDVDILMLYEQKT